MVNYGIACVVFLMYVIMIHCQTNVLTLTIQEKRAILDKHNEIRKDCANGEYTINGPEYAANMVHLFWDKGLENMAKKRASYCYFGHFRGSQGIREDFNENKRDATFVVPRSGFVIGENVGIYRNNPPLRNRNPTVFNSGVEGWAREGLLYDWPNNQCESDSKTCGHWAQVCSGRTRYVGCAFAECYDGVSGPTGDIGYQNGGMILVCNYFPGWDSRYYPFEDGRYFNDCHRCKQWDVDICEDNVCKGGKASHFLSSGLINHTIDQCTDGLGRRMNPCTNLDPTMPPTKGSLFNRFTDPPVTRSPSTSRQPTRRPSWYGTPLPKPTISPIITLTGPTNIINSTKPALVRNGSQRGNSIGIIAVIIIVSSLLLLIVLIFMLYKTIMKSRNKALAIIDVPKSSNNNAVMVNDVEGKTQSPNATSFAYNENTNDKKVFSNTIMNNIMISVSDEDPDILDAVQRNVNYVTDNDDITPPPTSVEMNTYTTSGLPKINETYQ